MGTAQRRLPVRFDDAVWREAVRGFSRGPLEIATNARSDAERRGVALAGVLPCEAHGPDGTAPAGCAKLYLPAGEAPASERPFAFVLQLAREMDSTLAWVFVAFGHRHPRAGVRSVYERAHRHLHGRFPERGRP
jgi:hypothetical protein